MVVGRYVKTPYPVFRKIKSDVLPTEYRLDYSSRNNEVNWLPKGTIVSFDLCKCNISCSDGNPV